MSSVLYNTKCARTDILPAEIGLERQSPHSDLQCFDKRGRRRRRLSLVASNVTWFSFGTGFAFGPCSLRSSTKPTGLDFA